MWWAPASGLHHQRTLARLHDLPFLASTPRGRHLLFGCWGSHCRRDPISCCWFSGRPQPNWIRVDGVGPNRLGPHSLTTRREAFDKVAGCWGWDTRMAGVSSGGKRGDPLPFAFPRGASPPGRGFYPIDSASDGLRDRRVAAPMTELCDGRGQGAGEAAVPIADLAARLLRGVADVW